MRLPLLLALVASAVLLGGCASYRAQLDSGHAPGGYQRFFVHSNLNDNHAIDRLLVSALKARGFVAEAGPLTMMPDDTQIIVTYQDRWAWDFRDHLVSLRVGFREARSSQPVASAVYTGHISLNKEPPTVVSRLIEELLGRTERVPATGNRP